MPYKLRKKGKKYQVVSPHGIKAKGTTLRKAKAQIRLLYSKKELNGKENR